LFLFALCFGAFSVQAQDIHFSQFYMSPLNLNPALTGVMNSQVRVVGNYRNQWASVLKSNAFATYSASYDQKIPVGRYDYFGIGGTFWGDKAGQLDFKTLQAKISASYSKRMGGYRSKSHYLVVGVEGGIAQRSIDLTAAQWGSQHDGEGGFNGLQPSGENFDNDNFIFPDLSAGLLWFTVFDERSNFYIGGAFSHLNRANQSFDSTQDLPLYSKLTLHAGGEFMGGGKIGLVPGVVALFQGPSFELNAGTSLKFLLGQGRSGDNQSFQIGVWSRLANRVNRVIAPSSDPDQPPSVTESTSIWADAIIISTRFDYNDFGIGFSYDLNVSKLKPASNGNGAFEFSIIYKIRGEEKRDVYCPNF
jgi:type IX secretion system PorP/SprF family membrane protein